MAISFHAVLRGVMSGVFFYKNIARSVVKLNSVTMQKLQTDSLRYSQPLHQERSRLFFEAAQTNLSNSIARGD